MGWHLLFISYKETAIAAGTGFVSGALAPFTGVGGTIAVNAALGGVQHVVTELVAHDKTLAEIDPVETALSMAVGGLAGAIQGTVPKEIAAEFKSEGALYGGRESLRRLGEATDAYARAVAPRTAAGMEKDLGWTQIASIVAHPVGTPRFLAGIALEQVSTSEKLLQK